VKEIAVVYATFGDRASAESAATQMVERHLAACANVQSPCLSVYRWNGATERSEETPVIFKTGVARRDALMFALAAVHGYELPAISSWTATTTAEYGDWVEAETRESA
jgi:periplasmic divalent cation tolerance protein